MNRSITLGGRRLRYMALRDALLTGKEFEGYGWSRATFGNERVVMYGATIAMNDDLDLYIVRDGVVWNAVLVQRADRTVAIVASARLWRRWQEWRDLMTKKRLNRMDAGEWRKLGRLWRQWGLSRELLIRHLEQNAIVTDTGESAYRLALEGYDEVERTKKPAQRD